MSRSSDEREGALHRGPEGAGHNGPADGCGDPPPPQEADFRSLVESARDGFAVLDLDGRALYVSPSISALLGYSRERLAQLSLSEAIHPDDLERVLALRRARREGDPSGTHYQLRLLHGTGRPLPVDLTVSPIIWEGETAELLVIRDIESSQQAREELQHREALLETVAFAARRLLASRRWEEEARSTLEMLARALQASLGFLWTVQARGDEGMLARRIARWTDPEAAGLPETPDSLQLGPSSRAWLDSLRRGAILRWSNAQTPPSVQGFLGTLGVQSVLGTPLFIESSWWGVLGVAHVDGRHRWPDGAEDSISAIASILQEHIQGQQVRVALEDSEARYRTVVDNAGVAIALIDSDGTCRFANRIMGSDLDLRPDEIEGRNLRDLYPEPFASSYLQWIRQALADQRSISLEAELAVGAGSRWYEIRIQPLSGLASTTSEVLIFCNDITARKTREARLRDQRERLRSLTTALSLAEQRHRKQIAADLHDRVGQNLAMAKIQLGILRQEVEDAESLRSLDSIQHWVDLGIGNVRNMVFELSPPVLHELGLGPALEWLGESFQSRQGIPTTVWDDGQAKPVGPDLQGLLFQAAQELLHNVAQHASAKSVRIRVYRGGRDLILEVEDDGRGFSPVEEVQNFQGRKGFGLFAIRERLEPYGGGMTIEARPGGGARIVLRAPVAASS